MIKPQMIVLIVALLYAIFTPAYSSLCLAGPSANMEKELRTIAGRHEIQPAHLLAIAEVESNFGKSGPGDDGKSIGMFQIQTELHKVRKSDALDWQWAAAWACRYLIERGYRKDYRRGIRKYNGGGRPGSKGYRMSCEYLKKVLKAAEKYEHGH